MNIITWIIIGTVWIVTIYFLTLFVFNSRIIEVHLKAAKHYNDAASYYLDNNIIEGDNSRRIGNMWADIAEARSKQEDRLKPKRFREYE